MKAWWSAKCFSRCRKGKKETLVQKPADVDEIGGGKGSKANYRIIEALKKVCLCRRKGLTIYKKKQENGSSPARRYW